MIVPVTHGERVRGRRLRRDGDPRGARLRRRRPRPLPLTRAWRRGRPGPEAVRRPRRAARVSVGRFCSRTWPARGDLAVGVDGLDEPDLLGPAAVQRGRGRGQRALADGAVEVGVVVDPDDLGPCRPSRPPRRRWPASRHRAVHAAVHDAVGLVQVGLRGPGRGHPVAGDLPELDAEVAHEVAGDVAVEGAAQRVGHARSIPAAGAGVRRRAETVDKLLSCSQRKCRT